MKPILFSLMAFLSMAYCGESPKKNCTIAIYNNTPYDLDSIKVSSYGVNIVIEEVKKGKKVERSFPMKDSGAYEGAFLMHVYSKATPKRDTAITFGYYANAASVNPRYNIELYGDLSFKKY